MLGIEFRRYCAARAMPLAEYAVEGAGRFSLSRDAPGVSRGHKFPASGSPPDVPSHLYSCSAAEARGE